MLALEMVEAGLVHDLAEAYTIVIPPFLHYHRLSDPPSDFMADYSPPIIPDDTIGSFRRLRRTPTTFLGTGKVIYSAFSSRVGL